MQDLTLDKLLLEAARLAAMGLRVSIPAEVVTYYPETFTADVQPLVTDPDTDEEGEPTTITLPQINGVPIVFMGGGGARVRFPVKPGHTVLLVVCSSPIDKYKIRGGMTDPGDTRRHHLSDAVAIPCVLDRAHAADEDVMIEFTESEEIHAGGDERLALKASLDALRSAIGSAGISLGAGGAASINTAADIAYGGTWNDGTTVLKGG